MASVRTRPSTFDPYHKWLAIPRGQRPPTYYQLLGIAPDESDAEVIAEAALRQTSHVRTYQTGPHAQQCIELLNEIARARTTLLDPVKRKAYDASLHPMPVEGPAPVPLPADGWPEPDAPIVRVAPARQPSRPDSWAHVFVLLYVLLLVLGATLAFRLASP